MDHLDNGSRVAVVTPLFEEAETAMFSEDAVEGKKSSAC
jgi:hypothetical protein